MILYHGSEKIIENPVFGKGNLRNDYGRGFYCTENEELAKEWACSNNKNGFANKYELKLEGLNILYLNSSEYHVLHWLTILTKNRTYWERNTISETAKTYLSKHFMIDTSKYDVIIGYRADDSYFSFARSFVNNEISLQQLGSAMHLGKLGEQIVLKSREAFRRIHFKSYEIANHTIYYIQRSQRDLGARSSWQAILESDDLDGLYMRDLMRTAPSEEELLMIAGTVDL